MRCAAAVVLIALAFGVKAQSTNRFELSRFSNEHLIKAIKYLDRSGDIPFSYNPDAIKSVMLPELPDTLISIDQFLQISLADTPLDFDIIGSTYVIFDRQLGNPEQSIRTNYSITGLVRNLVNREALPYASVQILTTSIGATTNTEGLFTLMSIPSDTLYLVASYLGFKPYKVRLDSLGKNQFLTIELTPISRNLPSVQVTAEHAEVVSIGPMPSQFTINPIDLYKIPSLGDTDVFNAIRKLPGVQSGIDAGSGLKIRGGQSDQNLVFFDGISVYHVDHFFGFFSAFNGNVVKNIQLRKGGFGARYGGRASGLVDITGIDGNKVKPQLTAEISSLCVNLVGELPIISNKASLTIAFRRSFTDLISSPTYRNIFNNIYNTSVPSTSENNTDVFEDGNLPDFVYYDFNLKFNIKPSDRDNITLSYYQGNDKLNYTFSSSFDDLNQVSNDDTQWGNNGASVKWSHRWSKQFYSNLNYGQSRYLSELEAEENYFFGADSLPASTWYYEQNTSVTDRSLRADQFLEFDHKQRVYFGYWYTGNEIKLEAQNQDTIFQDSLQSGSLHAIYGEYEYQMGKLAIKGGIRMAYFNNLNDWFPEPRFSASYATPAITYKLSYGRHHQMIRRLNERSLYFSIPETWVLASPTTVPVLQSDHYIGGFTSRLFNWDLDVEAFYKSETGTVESIFPEFGIPSGDLAQFAQNGNRRIFGADFLAKRRFNQHSILLAYAYLDAQSKFEQENGGNYFPSGGFAKHEFNVQYNFEYKQWDFSLGFLLSSGAPYTPILGTFTVELPNGEIQQFVSLGAINSAQLEWYHRMDVSANYTFDFEKTFLQMGISLYNVYNNQGIRFIDYFVIPEENSNEFNIGQRNALSLGFTPSFFVKIKL